jgi:hypothetical protein
LGFIDRTGFSEDQVANDNERPGPGFGQPIRNEAAKIVHSDLGGNSSGRVLRVSIGKSVRRRWTRFEDNLLHNMAEARLAAGEIARRLARTPAAIYSRIQYLDKKRRRRTATRSGWP